MKFLNKFQVGTSNLCPTKLSEYSKTCYELISKDLFQKINSKHKSGVGRISEQVEVLLFFPVTNLRFSLEYSLANFKTNGVWKFKKKITKKKYIPLNMPLVTLPLAS